VLELKELALVRLTNGRKEKVLTRRNGTRCKQVLAGDGFKGLALSRRHCLLLFEVCGSGFVGCLCCCGCQREKRGTDLRKKGKFSDGWTNDSPFPIVFDFGTIHSSRQRFTVSYWAGCIFLLGLF
jgi:hypothetical protein